MEHHKRKRDTDSSDSDADSSDSDGDFPVPGGTGGSGAEVIMGRKVDPTWESVLARVMDSVVMVVCEHSPPNFSQPWSMKEPYYSSSSGFVISGRRVLTNAHSVEDYSQVMLKKHGSDTIYLATVLAIGIECDIAMLTVANEEFWHGMSPIEIGDLPALGDEVIVVGYPDGTISTTGGVVFPIEIIYYSHGSAELLGLQIDEALRFGNSGGPAIDDIGNCAGIAFQSEKDTGHLISTPVIKHFIRDYEKNGAYTGFPVLGIEWQKMINHELRLAMGMGDHKGVRIRRIYQTAPTYGIFKPSDAILCIDGVDIANDGTVLVGVGRHINFSYLISQKYINDIAVIKVLRNSEILKFNIKLGSHKKLIPAQSEGGSPSYYIIAGFVFITVSVSYLRSKYGENYKTQVPIKFLDKLDSMPESPDEQFVVISKVLVADINFGYKDITDNRVLAFNGKPVKNLKSLASMVENYNDEHLEFSLEDDQIVALDSLSKAATLDILATYNISSAMSDNIKE